ncbi:hypothetical protein AB0I28_15075 [Phytomonospora sp. NPDC050363]|uniref:hypothetical protein n=1 Tax=Phytomonospora sp. NPDC050363 TaxID=3155642 RepID=UPI003408BC03
MSAFKGGRGRTALTAAGAVVLLLVAIGVYVLTRPPEGQVAMNFLAAIERGDLKEAQKHSFADPGGPAVSDTIVPTYPWTPERIVKTAPNESSHDYDAVIEAGSTDLTLSVKTELTFAVGSDDGRDVVLYPLVKSSIVVEEELTSLTVAGREVGAGSMELLLLPGIYDVVGVRADGVRVSGRLTVGGLGGEMPVVELRG